MVSVKRELKKIKKQMNNSTESLKRKTTSSITGKNY